MLHRASRFEQTCFRAARLVPRSLNLWRALSAQAHGAPAWLQPTYELDSELPAFIGDFQERERARSDSLWILKPWNMARSIDASVTRNLVQIIR